MAPKKKKETSPPSSSDGMFSGMFVFLLDDAVQPRRLQIWKQRLEQMGAKIEGYLSKRVTHIFAMNWNALKQKIDSERLSTFKGSILVYQWLEDSLRSGEKVSEDFYLLKEEPSENVSRQPSGEVSGNTNGNSSGSEEPPHHKKPRSSSPQNSNDSTRSLPKDSRDLSAESKETRTSDELNEESYTSKSYDGLCNTLDSQTACFNVAGLPDNKVKTISLFGEVWGVGPTTAQKLYDKGHRTLEDLKNDPSLTKAQKLGLQYFDDIKTRIPRHEVSEMEKMLQKIGEEVLPGVVIVCGGSYRRGKSSCGDMDIIITHPDGQSHKGFLAKFVRRLKDINFLREDLAVSYHSEEGKDSGVDTYFGLCTYPGRELRHRIDLKVFPKSIYPFGLIHWTGNDTLNRRLRILASSKGYRLDDTGLFFATQSSGGQRGSKGTTSLHFDTEKEVFDFLEFPWLEPHERNL